MMQVYKHYHLDMKCKWTWSFDCIFTKVIIHKVHCIIVLANMHNSFDSPITYENFPFKQINLFHNSHTWSWKLNKCKVRDTSSHSDHYTKVQLENHTWTIWRDPRVPLAHGSLINFVASSIWLEFFLLRRQSTPHIMSYIGTFIFVSFFLNGDVISHCRGIILIC